MGYGTVKEIEIQANIISGGKIINRGGSVILKGSVYGQDIENHGVLNINYCPGGSDLSEYFHTQSFQFLKKFKINFIKENEDE